MRSPSVLREMVDVVVVVVALAREVAKVRTVVAGGVAVGMGAVGGAAGAMVNVSSVVAAGMAAEGSVEV